MKPHYGCPVKATINVLSGKWKVLAVWHVAFGPKRFAELRDILPGVTEKVLTSQLRQLEEDGVLRRTVGGTVPPKVTYSLSPAGKDLVPLMEEMCTWGTKHLGIRPNLPRLPRAARRKAAQRRAA
jgi:DNA-binding HxlR family transcriptional regulator